MVRISASYRVPRFLGPVLVFQACSLAGCAGFQLAPYHQVVQDAVERSRLLGEVPEELRLLNRSAALPDRSQVSLKRRLIELWHPSLRPAAWLNYSGLAATRFSQLNTRLGPVFRPGVLTVDHLGRATRVPYIAAVRHAKRLPLVVGVSGINGTVDGKITVDILQSLYDSGAFHVIHLESITGVAHQVNNERPFAGGYPEGLLLYEVLAALRTEWDAAPDVTQIHLLGVSFGGLVTGIAAWHEYEVRRGVVDGAILALSPPLDLEILFENLTVHRIIHNRVREGYVVAGRDQFIKPAGFPLTEREFAELDFQTYMSKVALPYVREVYPELKQQSPMLPAVREVGDLYEISSLRSRLDRLPTPYMAVFAYDDPVVSPEDHYHQILMRSRNPLVEGILFKDGGHLGFDAVCGYPFTSRLALEYFRYWSVGD